MGLLHNTLSIFGGLGSMFNPMYTRPLRYVRRGPRNPLTPQQRKRVERDRVHRKRVKRAKAIARRSGK